MTTRFNLTPLNTMGLHAHAQHGAVITSQEDFENLVELSRTTGLPLRIIGGGSNLLPHEDVNAIVGVMAIKGVSVHEDGAGNYLVTAQAGEDWSQFVEKSVAQGAYGLENLAGIPGTVGAAPIQNIGAYGLEIADRFHSLTAYDLVEHTNVTFSKEDCAFAYRESIFKHTDNRYIVLDVTFLLPVNWQPLLTYNGLNTLPEDVDAPTVMYTVIALRHGKLPDWRELGNCGSFFHNPVVSAEVADAIEGVQRYPQADGTVKLSAAWLIDSCGLKGFRMGPVGVYEGHALILVNYGGATFTDIAALAAHIKQTVHARFGVMLTQEPIEL